MADPTLQRMVVNDPALALPFPQLVRNLVSSYNSSKVVSAPQSEIAIQEDQAAGIAAGCGQGSGRMPDKQHSERGILAGESGATDKARPTDLIPTSTLELKDCKVSVILSLHTHFRMHVQFWHDQAFKAMTWSFIAAYGLIAYLLDISIGAQKSGTMSINLLIGCFIVVAVIIALIFFFSRKYLNYCNAAYQGNWKQIINCEVALNLYTPDFYLLGCNFFDALNDKPNLDTPRKRDLHGMPADDILSNRRAHAWAMGIAICLVVALVLCLIFFPAYVLRETPP